MLFKNNLENYNNKIKFILTYIKYNFSLII